MIEIFILSLVQGITEFLPISSSSHLILISKYFNELKDNNSAEFGQFETYLTNFFYFCFEHSLDNMIDNSDKFKL